MTSLSVLSTVSLQSSVSCTRKTEFDPKLIRPSDILTTWPHLRSGAAPLLPFYLSNLRNIQISSIGVPTGLEIRLPPNSTAMKRMKFGKITLPDQYHSPLPGDGPGWYHNLGILSGKFCHLVSLGESKLSHVMKAMAGFLKCWKCRGSVSMVCWLPHSYPKGCYTRGLSLWDNFRWDKLREGHLNLSHISLHADEREHG